MNHPEQLDTYIDRFRRRLKALATARGIALLAGTALAITVVVVVTADRTGFPDGLVLGGRIVLFASLAALAWRYIARPRARIGSAVGPAIEMHTPAFGGRVETYLGMRQSGSPLYELLAEDTLGIAERHPPATVVPTSAFRLAWLGAGAALLVLVLLAIAGPGNTAFGVRQLWVGWAFPGLLPPQSVAVTPGDTGIRQGGNLEIRAETRGFTAAAATVHVSFGDGDWQRVPMSGDDGAFEFVFFSVREPLEYYVSANNVRSPAYSVAVVDLPVVEKLVLAYRYPDWTGRDADIRDPGGDVRVVEGTEVEVRVVTDRPMTPGELIVDDASIPLRVDGTTATASFDVEADGRYHVAALVGGESIRLTDDYFITAEDDEPPVIEFARPGRDWSASSIEEVTAEIAASDDFGIESLTLSYSVNGGDWQEVELPVEGTDTKTEHVFFLESLAPGEAGKPLSPGDLIAYFAAAEDRGSSARTDMFFVDVQPFDRRYSQSQAGGQMGGMQGGRQDEISQRQREIIISTWNLIREQSGAEGKGPAYVADNAALLARLQTTLREQVESLARRSEARELTSGDADIARFVEHLTKAAAAMGPAAERLDGLDLEQALLPEQEALQHLLAAEAVFTDISVSLQAGNRGSGGQAGRDLTEMFELEMDLEKNQYETGSRAAAEAPEIELEEAADELAELARRQEQLARNRQARQTPVPAQRWQQEMLRRDVEELRERLERLSRSAAADPTGAEPGASGQARDARAGEGLDRELEELGRRLDSALRAMNEADRALSGNTNPDELERSMQEARRQLEAASERANEVRAQALEAAVADLAERAGDLHDRQAELDLKLQEAVRRVLLERADQDRIESGMTYAEELALATRKRELLAALEALEREARNVARDLEDDLPRAADTIGESIEHLEEQQVEARLAVAAAYIEQGEALYVASSESVVTDALRRLRDDLERAEELVAGGAAGVSGDDSLRATLAATRQLRRALRRLADEGPDEVHEDDDAIGRELGRQTGELSDRVAGLLREFAAAGLPAREIDELRRTAVALGDAQFTGNPELLEAESRFALTLVEQLELALRRPATAEDGSVRTSADPEIPAEYRDIVADYYRRLGNASESAGDTVSP